MTHFSKNAQEDALVELAVQAKVRNEYDLLRELRELDAISEADYIECLRRLWKRAHD